ncbi:sugar phosphate isomerase/epimerase [Arsenicitalea aurantiaca]|uniref:Sugar phosphate isomerase/epimerase n=1 Tax=Arsenicitalea aurantiaca TaxID=1783274 RepID=A0A433XBL5_9HYPH|nr:sugar phosphate isomerase/epimerase [Arsenicitalea aurantiaca]RUT31378.1 sugar phosphate isomerase/epimerase [Arsenicitalea aurantiaca]
MKKLGIHSFVWTGGTTQEDLEGAMEKSHALGYGLVEFPRLDPSKFDVAWLARRLKDYELDVVVTMGLPKDADISSEDPEAVKRGEQVLKDAVAVTRDLGGKKLGGIIFSAHGKYYSLPTQKGWDNSVSVMSRVADIAKDAGVSLNLEVVNRFESNLINTAAQGMKFIADAGSDNIFLHLDTFHMNIEEADPAQAIHHTGDRLGYFHIGESNRGFLGSGTIDFAPIFDALHAIGYEDYLTFESFSSEVVDEDLSITCGIWRNTWTDNVEVARLAKAFIEARQGEAIRKARTARTA